MTGIHTCQPARVLDGGPRDRDPDFPHIYVTDPWCWSETLGFHRASSPHIRREITVRTKGTRVVGPDYMSSGQCIALGLGVGTSNWGSYSEANIREMLYRVLECVEDSEVSAEEFARMGAAMAGLVRSGVQDRLSEDGSLRREWFRISYQAIINRRNLEAWQPILERAACGTSTKSDALTVDRLYKLLPVRGNYYSYPEQWLIYFSEGVFRNCTSDKPHHGGMRSHARAARFCMSRPGDRVKWIFEVFDIARRLGGS